MELYDPETTPQVTETRPSIQDLKTFRTNILIKAAKELGIDIPGFQQQIQSLEQQIQKLEQQMDNLIQKNKDKEKEKKLTEEKYYHAAGQAHDLRNELDNAKTQLEQLRAENQKYRQAAGQAAGQAHDLRNKLDDANGREIALKTQLKELKTRNHSQLLENQKLVLEKEILQERVKGIFLSDFILAFMRRLDEGEEDYSVIFSDERRKLITMISECEKCPVKPEDAAKLLEVIALCEDQAIQLMIEGIKQENYHPITTNIEFAEIMRKTHQEEILNEKLVKEEKQAQEQAQIEKEREARIEKEREARIEEEKRAQIEEEQKEKEAQKQKSELRQKLRNLPDR